MRETALSPSTPDENKDIEFSKERTKPLHLSPEVFETVSKKTWVDVLMQILKVRIPVANWDEKFDSLCRVSFLGEWHQNPTNNWAYPIERNPCQTSTRIPPRVTSMASVNGSCSPGSTIAIPTIGNKSGLTEINVRLSNERETSTDFSGFFIANMPSGRWIVNFDIDLVDSIVLGTVLGAYCPFLVRREHLYPYRTGHVLSSPIRRSSHTCNGCMCIQRPANNISRMHWYWCLVCCKLVLNTIFKHWTWRVQIRFACVYSCVFSTNICPTICPKAISSSVVSFTKHRLLKWRSPTLAHKPCSTRWASSVEMPTNFNYWKAIHWVFLRRPPCWSTYPVKTNDCDRPMPFYSYMANEPMPIQRQRWSSISRVPFKPLPLK